MKFIVTNDDGYDAPGVAALAGVARSLGETTVVAPLVGHSALGHRVTTTEPIEVSEGEPGMYRVDGTPADCARLAIACLAPDAAWLLAGINRGGNLGADVYMSGTVAAAREAALLGRRAIALSHYLARGIEIDWNVAGARARRVIELLLGRETPAGYFWNVNLPHCPDREPEVVFCPLDPSPLYVEYRREGSAYMYKGNYHGRERHAGTDVDLCFRGSITITPIPLAFAPAEIPGGRDTMVETG